MWIRKVSIIKIKDLHCIEDREFDDIKLLLNIKYFKFIDSISKRISKIFYKLKWFEPLSLIKKLHIRFNNFLSKKIKFYQVQTIIV